MTQLSIPGLKYRFKQMALLEEALTHRSKSKVNYERLEFLGDSVLNLIVSDRLYKIHPAAAEGDLSRMRARVVRGETLADIASKLDLGEYLRLGEGELKSGGHRRRSILADALEAVIGAVFLDAGFTTCYAVVARLCDPVIEALPDAESLKDPKTRLQELLQARGVILPEYILVDERGADHAKEFTVACQVPGLERRFEASGSSRRKAEKAAANLALAALQTGEE